jgi:Pentapeptide repeats (8 copies)
MRWTWPRGASTALSVVLAAVGIVAAVLALLLLPPWLVDQAGASLEGADLTRAVTEERRTVLAVLAAIGAAVTLWYTHQRQELDRDANRTDRYTKAVEQLGDDSKPSVQLGGVYALERVAKDSRRDRAVSIEVLSAFVRQQSKPRAVGTEAVATAEGADWEDPTSFLASGAHRPSEPVLAALSVLARRPSGDHTYPAPNLMGATLNGANLNQANLTEASLIGAHLAGANLADADLTGANLHRADLTFADLADADLTGAILTDVIFTDANLRDAKLAGAYLAGANLANANLTGANLADVDLTGVRYDELTTWPEGFTPRTRRR